MSARNSPESSIPFPRWLALALVLASAPVLWAETMGEIRLANGRTVPGWIQSVREEGVVWKARNGQVGTFPMAAVEEVRLLAPEDFQTAVTDLQRAPSAAAVAVLERYADPAHPESYHPLPGNLASRAAHELFLFHRRRGDAGNAAAWAGRLDYDFLPRVEPPPLLDLYRALGDPSSEAFRTRAAERLGNAAPSEQKEIRYLIGVRHEREGEGGEALAAYGGVYSPDLDLLDPFCGFALERSIRLLESDPPPAVSDPGRMAEQLRGVLALFSEPAAAPPSVAE